MGNGRCWFGGFGGRYFTLEDLPVEFDIGEESSEVVGDVNRVILFYRFLHGFYPCLVMPVIFEIRGLSVGGCGVIEIWRWEWNLCYQIALSPKMGK